MASLNKVTLIGNLGSDVELRQTNGGAVANLSVATSYKPKQGDDKTEWHRVTVWGVTAENCAKYLHKGSSVYVEGRLETRSYEKDGVKKYATDVIADRVMFLDSKGGKDRGSRPAPAPTAHPAGTPPDDTDIPF